MYNRYMNEIYVVCAATSSLYHRGGRQNIFIANLVDIYGYYENCNETKMSAKRTEMSPFSMEMETIQHFRQRLSYFTFMLPVSYRKAYGPIPVIFICHFAERC